MLVVQYFHIFVRIYQQVNVRCRLLLCLPMHVQYMAIGMSMNNKQKRGYRLCGSIFNVYTELAASVRYKHLFLDNWFLSTTFSNNMADQCAVSPEPEKSTKWARIRIPARIACKFSQSAGFPEKAPAPSLHSWCITRTQLIIKACNCLNNLRIISMPLEAVVYSSSPFIQYALHKFSYGLPSFRIKTQMT